MWKGLICLRGFISDIFSLQDPLLHRVSKDGGCLVISVDLKPFVIVNAIKLNVQKIR
jgi:hypothetical protein